MKTKDLFFHIHYCNSRLINTPDMYKRKSVKKLQHHELAYIKGGKGFIIINNKRYQILEGLILYVSPDIPYTMELNMEGQGLFLSVHFSYVNVVFNDGKWRNESGMDVLPLQSVQELKDSYQVEDIFKKLIASWDEKLPGYEFVARTSLQQLLIAIYQNFNKQNHNYSISMKVEKIIQHMHQNVNGRISLTGLSELVKMAPTYLSRTFKKSTGYSVIEYFNKIKVDKAKELIIEGNGKVKEVSQALGFTDEFYFSRIFKRIEGISPSEYYSKNVHGN